MKKLFALAVITAAAVSFQAQAEEMKAPAAEMKAEAMEMKAEAKGMKADAMMAKKVELKDGTKVEVKGQDVFVIGKDGKAMPAPDGTHTAKDGSTMTTKGGKIVQ